LVIVTASILVYHLRSVILDYLLGLVFILLFLVVKVDEVLLSVTLWI
jgi:hypothetical protein